MLLALACRMLKDFHAFQAAVEFYDLRKTVKIPLFLKDQLLRASSSVALNIAEGSGKRTFSDQRRYYAIALGSIRECEAIMALEKIQHPELRTLSSRIGAMLFRLCKIHQETQNGTINDKR